MSDLAAMADRSRVGARIKRARLRRGLTQSELAHRIDSADAQVSRWENGHAMPRISSLEAMADVLGVSPEALFAGGD